MGWVRGVLSVLQHLAGGTHKELFTAGRSGRKHYRLRNPMSERDFGLSWNEGMGNQVRELCCPAMHGEGDSWRFLRRALLLSPLILCVAMPSSYQHTRLLLLRMG